MNRGRFARFSLGAGFGTGTSIPRRSRPRSQEAPTGAGNPRTTTREKPCSRANPRLAQISPGSRIQPVTPEVAGSSPVAPAASAWACGAEPTRNRAGPSCHQHRRARETGPLPAPVRCLFRRHRCERGASEVSSNGVELRSTGRASLAQPSGEGPAKLPFVFCGEDEIGRNRPVVKFWQNPPRRTSSHSGVSGSLPRRSQVQILPPLLLSC